MYLYIVISTAVVYYLMITLDDKRNLKLHKPPASVGMKLAFLFFSFILSTVLVHFFIGSTEMVSPPDQEYINLENKNIQHILQEVEVGLPQF